MHDIKTDDVRRSIQDLGKTWVCPSLIARYEFFDVETGFAENFDNKSAVLFFYKLNIKDSALTDFVCSPVSDPYGRALLYCDAL